MVKDFKSLGRRGVSGASGLCIDSSRVKNITTVEVVKTVSRLYYVLTKIEGRPWCQTLLISGENEASLSGI